MIVGLIEKLHIRRLLRGEYETLALRMHFARHWLVDFDQYRYGRFHLRRRPGSTRIGRCCSLAKILRTLDASHGSKAIITHPGLYEARSGITPRDLINPPWLNIGDDVWIIHNAIIIPGCKSIGGSAIIGAKAVVAKAVQAYAIMTCQPTRKLLDGFDAETMAVREPTRRWKKDKSELAKSLRRLATAASQPSPATLAFPA